MLERFLLAVGLILLGWLAYLLLMRLQLTRRNGQSLHLPGYQAGLATILYFFTPDCAPCRTIQGPALNAVKDKFGRKLKIIQIDASRQHELADSWGVLSVPTTFIIDPHGRPRGVNHGVTRADTLSTQLEAIGVQPRSITPSSRTQLAQSRES